MLDQEQLRARLQNLHDFNQRVIGTIRLAFDNGMGEDFLSLIGCVTAAAAKSGADPAADLAAIAALNKILSDLIEARKQVEAQAAS